MAFFGWIAEHWFDLLQTTSIVVGLFATAHSIRADTTERKIQNLLSLTAAHRELWTRFMANPDTHRIYEVDIDLVETPTTLQERRFVQLLILHLRAAYKARKAGMEFSDDALASDIRQFFARPIPRLVWEEAKAFQDVEFVAFVESCF
jgi:hypothetical protein